MYAKLLLYIRMIATEAARKVNATAKATVVNAGARGRAVRNAGQIVTTNTNAEPSAKGGTAMFLANASSVVAASGKRGFAESAKCPVSPEEAALCSVDYSLVNHVAVLYC